MLFQRPYLLALLVPLLYISWRYPHANRHVTWLRRLLFTCLALAIAGMTWPVSSEAGYCIALVDRSRSISQETLDKETAYLKEMDATRPHETRLGILGYSAKTTVEKHADETPFVGLQSAIEDSDATFLANALEEALRLIPQEAPARIVILGDGQWNGAEPGRAFASAASRGIPVDYRLWMPDYDKDVSIESLQAPISVYPGESFAIECAVNSPVECKALLKLRRNEGKWNERPVALHKGTNLFSWSDTAEQAGTVRYELLLETPDFQDGHLQNNHAAQMVTIHGEKSILVITSSPSANLSKSLEVLHFKVRTESPSTKLLTPALLAGCSCVVLENVSASKLGRDGLDLLAMTVSRGSLGLVMTGGKNSFASGGYYKSPLEGILPVELMQRQEERKAQVAMVVALDRSGSMGIVVADGITKMDLANKAALEVFTLLRQDDEFGLLAVDSSSHVVLPLSKVGSLGNAGAKITSIESMGGGIYTYTALHDATAMLLKSQAQVRHLILFADANDAEEPGQYRTLLEKATQAGITVSAIALGTESDTDAPFLMDVARRGKGEIYFTDRSDDLPRIFAEDTYKVALNTFVEGTVSSTLLSPMQEITSTLVDAFSFNGYNLVFPRESAQVALASNDDNQAPLVAFHRVGLGRCAILAFEVDGEYTGAFASHPQAATLLGGVVNWANLPPEDTGDYLITQTVRNGMMHLEIALEPSRSQDPFSATPQVSTLIWQKGAEPTTENRPFAWASPDRLEADIPMSGVKSYLPGILLNGKNRPLPPASLPYSPEYAIHQKAPVRLMELARMTGGRERLRASQIWERIILKREHADTTPLFTLLCIALLLLEVAERRFVFLHHILSAFPRMKPISPKRHPAPSTADDLHAPASTPQKPHVTAPSQASRQDETPINQPEPPAQEETPALFDALKRASRHNTKP